MIWAVNLVQVQYSQQIQVGKRRRRGNGFLPSTELLSCMRIEEGEKHNTKATWRLHSTLFFKISVNQHQNGLCVIHFFSPFLLCGYHYRASSSKLLAVILKIENWIYSDNNGDSVMWRKKKKVSSEATVFFAHYLQAVISVALPTSLFLTTYQANNLINVCAACVMPQECALIIITDQN